MFVELSRERISTIGWRERERGEIKALDVDANSLSGAFTALIQVNGTVKTGTWSQNESLQSETK